MEKNGVSAIPKPVANSQINALKSGYKNDDLDELAEAFRLFLVELYKSGEAKKETENYLKLNQRQERLRF